jgi:geranylgeranyl pyrophosphate synthase
MDIHEQVIEYFSNLPAIQEWENVQVLFEQIASGKPYHWLLPVRACEAAGGTREQALPAVTAIGCAHISIILVDDMLDSDPRGEFRRIGAPATANLACAFQAAGLDALALGEKASLASSRVLANFNRMYFMTALGQHWDVQCPADEDSYWRMVRTKSSPFFGVALQIGAMLGRASNHVAKKLDEIGRIYGEMIQIHDDLNDTMAFPANPDWLHGRFPLPILFAQSVNHPDRLRFIELRENISSQDALLEAQEILIRCGAVSYCIDQLLCRHQAAQEILYGTKLARPDLVKNLLEEVIAPVRKLLDAVGDI